MKRFVKVLLQGIFNRVARNLRGMKDVFKEQGFGVEKLHCTKLTKDVLETIFTSTSTILVTY